MAFSNKKSWQRLISYGCVMAKVALDQRQVLGGDERTRRIGYLADLHLMAYQGKENQLGVALDRVREALAAFRQAHTDPENEETVFAVIGGDFNFDNVSPGRKKVPFL